jgi:hypothetical protein
MLRSASILLLSVMLLGAVHCDADSTAKSVAELQSNAQASRQLEAAESTEGDASLKAVLVCPNAHRCLSFQAFA